MEILNSNNISLSKFVEFTSYLSVDIVSIIIPISFAVSAAFVYHRFRESNQLVALQSIGGSPVNLLTPLLLLAFLLMGFIYVCNMYISPFAWATFRSMEFNIKNNIDPPENSGSLFSKNGFNVYAQQYRGNFSFGNIYIIDSRNESKTCSYYAKSGTIRNSMLLLIDGERIEMDKIENKHSIVKFKSYQYNLKNILTNSKKQSQANEKFVDELLQDTDDGDQNMERKALFHQKILSPLLAIIFPLLSFLFVILTAHRRKSSYSRIIALVSAIIFIQGTFFWMANASAKNPTLIGFNYIFIWILLVTLLMLVIFRRRNRI
ncbi:hypothetical protein FACS189449_04080 [Alphaproteobacteria bacterium]|nr:hypothetical protein FACS189449_04080 [Alphaproteobacteria bacterium]